MMMWICQADLSFIRRWLLVLFPMMFVHQTAVAADIRSIQLVADTAGAWFLDGKLPFGVELKTATGIHKRTTGYLNGSMGWRNFEISCDQGTISKGRIDVNLNSVRQNRNQLVIIARHKRVRSLTDTLVVAMPTAISIQLLVDDHWKITPGSVLEPAVQVRYTNGIVYTCLPWSGNSMLSPEMMELFYNKEKVADGKIRLGDELKETMKNPLISVVWKENREVFDMRELPLTFEVAETAYYSEFPARDGQQGNAGADGKDGQAGQNGQAGTDARLLKLMMWMDQDSSLLRMRTNYDEVINDYTLVPGVTGLNIIIKGADGGKGGNGGDGGKGVADGNSDGGKGGDGGMGGDGGRGGVIEIYVSPEAEKYLPQLNINNSGGNGGAGGAGGRGGKRAITDGASLFEVLFPGRNADGYQGMPGAFGENGPPAKILPLDPSMIK
jgi:hypothetical protein